MHLAYSCILMDPMLVGKETQVFLLFTLRALNIVSDLGLILTSCCSLLTSYHIIFSWPLTEDQQLHSTRAMAEVSTFADTLDPRSHVVDESQPSHDYRDSSFYSVQGTHVRKIGPFNLGSEMAEISPEINITFINKCIFPRRKYYHYFLSLWLQNIYETLVANKAFSAGLTRPEGKWKNHLKINVPKHLMVSVLTPVLFS